ncbi:MAG: hypothetical protein OEV78_08645 [Spirochaetia bacterium]|nr:hypothetical protein [Spirochaetia bacterium]
MSFNLKFIPMFFLCFNLLGCTSNVTYRFEILNSPVGMIAFNNTPLNYTELNFYAYNHETDFTGYEISTGTTKSLSIANPSSGKCLFTVNYTLNKPTKVQLGGVKQAGFDCHIPGIAQVPVSNWVSVVSIRDCSNYPAGSGCTTNSEPVSAEVLPYVAPPSSATIQYINSPANYYMLTVVMGTPPTKGIGLFYSYSKEEAESKAAEDGSIYDGFCNLTASGTLLIQIGGSPVGGANCYISNFYIYPGDTLAIRTGDNRIKYPWSDFVSVTIP